MHLITTIVVNIAQAAPHLFERDSRSMRLTWGGGQAVDPEVFREFERRLGGGRLGLQPNRGQLDLQLIRS